MQNRSVPCDTVLPHVNYSDVEKAVAWLARTFGFREHYRYGEPGGPPSGAQMILEKACIMVKASRGNSVSPAQCGHDTQSLTVFLEDVDVHYATAKAAGANIVEELHVTCYGERQYGVVDFEGHHWLFSRHVQDLSPAEWGAVMLADITRRMIRDAFRDCVKSTVCTFPAHGGTMDFTS